MLYARGMRAEYPLARPTPTPYRVPDFECHTRSSGLGSCAFAGTLTTLVRLVKLGEEADCALHTERLLSPIISLERTYINENVELHQQVTNYTGYCGVYFDLLLLLLLSRRSEGSQLHKSLRNNNRLYDIPCAISRPRY